MPQLQNRQFASVSSDDNGVVDARLLKSLAKFSTPTVANVLALIDSTRRAKGFAGGAVRAVHRGSRPIVGFAVTATCRSVPGGDPATPRLTTDEIIDHGLSSSQPPIIVLQDLEPKPRSAVFGEMIGTAFASFGYAGLITNGACRDVAELRRLRFPCWSSGNIVGFAGSGYIECGVPVEIDGLHIQPGDLLHADLNGILQVPTDSLAHLVQGCKRFTALEERALARMKAMTPRLAELQEIFQELRASLQQLRQHNGTKVSIAVESRKPLGRLSDVIID